MDAKERAELRAKAKAAQCDEFSGSDATWAYVRAFSPGTALRLLDDYNKLEKRLEALRSAMDHACLFGAGDPAAMMRVLDKALKDDNPAATEDQDDA